MGKLQEREIAELAYALYEKSGWAQGKDEEHWLEAERVIAARSAKGTGKGGRKAAGKAANKSTAKPAKKPAKASAKKSAKESTKASL